MDVDEETADENLVPFLKSQAHALNEISKAFGQSPFFKQDVYEEEQKNAYRSLMDEETMREVEYDRNKDHAYDNYDGNRMERD